jgi:hypothetical protein
VLSCYDFTRQAVIYSSMKKVDFIYLGQSSYFTWKQMGEMRFITCHYPIFKSAFKGQDCVMALCQALNVHSVAATAGNISVW